MRRRCGSLPDALDDDTVLLVLDRLCASEVLRLVAASASLAERLVGAGAIERLAVAQLGPAAAAAAASAAEFSCSRCRSDDEEGLGSTGWGGHGGCAEIDPGNTQGQLQVWREGREEHRVREASLRGSVGRDLRPEALILARSTLKVTSRSGGATPPRPQSRPLENPVGWHGLACQDPGDGPLYGHGFSSDPRSELLAATEIVG